MTVAKSFKHSLGNASFCCPRGTHTLLSSGGPTSLCSEVAKLSLCTKALRGDLWNSDTWPARLACIEIGLIIGNTVDNNQTFNNQNRYKNRIKTECVKLSSLLAKAGKIYSACRSEALRMGLQTVRGEVEENCELPCKWAPSSRHPPPPQPRQGCELHRLKVS